MFTAKLGPLCVMTALKVQQPLIIDAGNPLPAQTCEGCMRSS